MKEKLNITIDSEVKKKLQILAESDYTTQSAMIQKLIVEEEKRRIRIKNREQENNKP